MAIKTICILKGPNAFKLYLAAAHIIDSSVKAPDMTITLEHLGYQRFDGKTLPFHITGITAGEGREGIDIEGWLDFADEPSRRIKGWLNFKSGANSWIEVEVD